ncbi:ribosome silencing factor [Fluviibacterium sp. S390]|uniref:ribosome silencing factor n=1 Tax=Fluviibacterium sp. S390 TaxID=3415139 RepID=UPI003C7D6710
MAVPLEGVQTLSRIDQAVPVGTAHPAPADVSLSAQSDETLARILSSLSEDKAEDVISIDLRGRSEMADHMVIATGRSSRQVSAMAEKLTDRLKHDLGVGCKVEGKDQGDWVLIDAGDAIVHLFRPEVREFYQLEKMWIAPGSAEG